MDSIGNLSSATSSTTGGGTDTFTNITITGVIAFQGGNVTGTTAALLGANAPSLADPTNPQTWITVIDANGNHCVFPVWKLA